MGRRCHWTAYPVQRSRARQGASPSGAARPWLVAATAATSSCAIRCAEFRQLAMSRSAASDEQFAGATNLLPASLPSEPSDGRSSTLSFRIRFHTRCRNGLRPGADPGRLTASRPSLRRHYPLYYILSRQLPLFCQSAPGPRPMQSTDCPFCESSTRRIMSRLTPGQARSRSTRANVSGILSNPAQGVLVTPHLFLVAIPEQRSGRYKHIAHPRRLDGNTFDAVRRDRAFEPRMLAQGLGAVRRLPRAELPLASEFAQISEIPGCRNGCRSLPIAICRRVLLACSPQGTRSERRYQ